MFGAKTEALMVQVVLGTEPHLVFSFHLDQ